VLGPIVERECGPASTLRILDCACGIGTQALGLAARGCRITACDLSPAAVERARLEASQRRLDLQLLVADMLDLSRIPETEFDAVICMGNALPHLESKKQLLQAASEIRRKMGLDATFIASIRDYDCLIREKPVVQGPSLYWDEGRRRIVHQLWDWVDDRRYALHLCITRETVDGWEAQHYVSSYRAVLRDELTSVLEGAGFTSVRWLLPVESGLQQPILVAKAGDMSAKRTTL
jgi:glycine/sarcosine N-methyltransferase